MDREKELSTYNHSVNIVERKNILISGVKKVDSFDEEEFLVETVMGYLVLKGEGLELIKLDTLQGTVSIKGLIKSFDYVDDVKKIKKILYLIGYLNEFNYTNSVIILFFFIWFIC